MSSETQLLSLLKSLKDESDAQLLLRDSSISRKLDTYIPVYIGSNFWAPFKARTKNCNNTKLHVNDLDAKVITLFKAISSTACSSTPGERSVSSWWDSLDSLRSLCSFLADNNPSLVLLIARPILIDSIHRKKKSHAQQLKRMVSELSQTTELVLSGVKHQNQTSLDDISLKLFQNVYSLSCLLNAIGLTVRSPETAGDCNIESLNCLFLAEADSSLKSLTTTGSTLLLSAVSIYEKVVPYYLEITKVGKNPAFELTDLYIVLQRVMQIFLFLLRMTCSSHIMAATSEDSNCSCSWGHLLINELSSTGEEDVHNHKGDCIADMDKVYATDMTVLLQKLSGNDPDMFAYFHSMVTQKSGLLSTTSVPAQRLEPDRNMSDTHTSTEVASTSAANGNGDGDAMEEQMQTLMSMFPDYSIEFLKCCLKEYSGHLERTIDGLLSGSLPPELTLLNRLTQQSATVTSTSNSSKTTGVWLTEASNGTDTSNKLARVLNVVEGVDNNQQGKLDRERQMNIDNTKNRALLMEKQRERDAMLLMREYNDDYDDQYDEGPSVSKEYFANDIAATEKQAKRTKGKGKEPEIHWEIRANEVKRYNALLRAEETEIAYWKQQENLNKGETLSGQSTGRMDAVPIPVSLSISSSTTTSSSKGMGGSDKMGMDKLSPSAASFRPGNSSSSSNSSTSKQAPHIKGSHRDAKPAAQGSNNGSSEGSNSGKNSGKPHYNTKKFDKHHQKDKSSRKNMM